MNKLIYTLIVIGLSVTAQARTLTIALDLSGSNPLLTHENFAHGAGQYLSKQIGALKNGDTVRLQSFGARDNALNLIDHTLKISRRQRPQAVARSIAEYVGSLPTRTDVAQASTNLIAWLEFTGDFNCSDSGQIIVLTDGLESSSYVDAQALLEGKAGLPKADVDLKGCSLTFYGLGAGFPAPSVKHIRNAWREWSGQAGAEFSAIIQ